MVRDISVDGGVAHVGIVLTIVGCPAADRISREVRAAAASVDGIADVALDVGVMSPDERRALTERLRGGRAAREMPFGPGTLTRVIAVTSGKGGVGKSTVTANLAVALAARGLVGRASSTPTCTASRSPALLGPRRRRRQRAAADPDRRPHAAAGRLRREGDLDRDVPAPERRRRARSAPWPGAGPMLHRTVQQFLTDVFFGDLDVLLLDMPPGTGDIAISVGPAAAQRRGRSW